MTKSGGALAKMTPTLIVHDDRNQENRSGGEVNEL